MSPRPTGGSCKTLQPQTTRRAHMIDHKKEDNGVIPFLSLATTAGQGEDNNINIPPTPERTAQTPRRGRNRPHPGVHPPQIHISKRIPGQQLAGAATSGLAEMGIELQPSYSNVTPPPPSRRRPKKT
jgi:hypothetical protein